MAKYIDAEALKNILDAKSDMATGTPKICFASVVKMIDKLPAADVAEVKRGEWKPYKTPIETRQSGWICTNCSGVVKDLSNGNSDFCPNCGAQMED